MKRSNGFYLFTISILIIICNTHDLPLLILKHFKLHLMKILKGTTQILILHLKFSMFRIYLVCVSFMSHLSLVFTWFMFRLCLLVMFRSLSYVFFFLFSLFLVDYMFPYFSIINEVPFYYVFCSLSLYLLFVFYFLFYYFFLIFDKGGVLMLIIVLFFNLIFMGFISISLYFI